MPRSEHRDATRRFLRPSAAALIGFVLALHTGVGAIAAEAGAPADAKEATFAPAKDGSIVVWNRPLFTMHAPFGHLDAAGRAEAAQQRIDAALDTMRPEEVTATWVQTGDAEGVLVRAGTLILFGILPADVDGDRAAAERAGQKVVADLKEILEERAASRRLPLLLRGLAVSLLALLAFAAIVHGLARARRQLHVRIERAAEQHGADRRARGLDLRPIAWGALRTLVDLVRLAATLALAYLTLSLVLRQFPYTRPWGEALGGYVVDAGSKLADAFVESIPQLAMLLVIWLVTRGLARVVSAWFTAIEHGTIESEWLDPQAAGATRRLVTIGIWLFAVTIAYPYIPGSETEAFKGVSVFVGLMLSLGSAGVLNQVVSGFVVLYSRAIRVGDFVSIGDKSGTVRELGLLSLKLVTRLNEEVTVPNAVLAGTLVENYTRQSRENGLLIATSVTIGYDTPWRQVHALLELAASRTPQLQKVPTPFVLQSALTDFYTQYQLNAAITRPQDRPFALSRLHAEIQDAFNEFGVQIMSPNFEAQPDGKVFVPRDQWHAAPADKADAPA
ncbi:MAG TPA: mechanosensitive ion channel domain-containing protein [Rhodanobacteraceae bacterium]|nr:mechanosensitive ion channel domain-containing protein [Rhodanobacteraceae bacterium]